MATILLVEETPDLAMFEASLLEQKGHRVLRCGGSPTLLTACPMLRTGWCSLADAADLIVFDCSFAVPMRGRSYTGSDLLRAYRAHAAYSRKPMLIVSVVAPEDVEGAGPFEVIPKFSDPEVITAGVERLLAAHVGAAHVEGVAR